MNRPLTGHIESPLDPRDYPFRETEVFGSASLNPRSIDTAGDGHIERDQYSQSCTQYTLYQAVQDLDRKLVELGAPVRIAKVNADGSFVLDDDGEIALAPEAVVMKRPLDLLGPIFGYAGARLMAMHAAGDNVPEEGLPDTGSSYRHGIMWMRDVENGGGVRLDTLFPDTPENARRLPPAHVSQGDPLVKVGSYYRIHGEGEEDDLRDGIIAALEGYLLGKCSKPMTSMMTTEGFVNTPEGQVYDSSKPGKNTGAHAMLVRGYDAAQDAVILHQTWQGRPRTYRVRIADLATQGIGRETWVLRNLIYIPRGVA